MDKRKLETELLRLNRPYVRMEMTAGDPGQVPVTKVSGAPWWPTGTKRPLCVDGHKMAFIAQIRLDEIPGFEQPPTLLSFHYCDQCAYDGKMSFGWEEKGHQQRYNCTIFADLNLSVDRLGIVTDSSVVAQIPTLQRGEETMNIQDIWERYPETSVPGGVPDMKGVNHEVRSKLGGWPSWVQSPLRPEDEMGNEMKFVAQLDMHAFPQSAWATGYAYLFASEFNEDDQEAELVIQTT